MNELWCLQVLAFKTKVHIPFDDKTHLIDIFTFTPMNYMLVQIHQNSWTKWGHFSFTKGTQQKKKTLTIFVFLFFFPTFKMRCAQMSWAITRIDCFINRILLFIINWLLLAEHSKTKYPCEPIVYRSAMRLDFTHLNVIFTPNNFRASYKNNIVHI